MDNRTIVEKYINTIESDNLIIEDMFQWIVILMEKKDLLSVLKEMGYERIAIYGYGYLGKLLELALKGSEIKTVCIYDQKYDNIDGYMRRLGGSVEEIDAVIVTVPRAYQTIRKDLIQFGYSCEIRLIDDFLFQL